MDEEWRSKRGHGIGKMNETEIGEDLKNINTSQAKLLINKEVIPKYSAHWRAVGYLEAIEKANILVTALKVIKHIPEFPDFKGDPIAQVDDMCDVVDEAFALWDKLK
jgi:hypothetical protein